jgi:hypothetical protein
MKDITDYFFGTVQHTNCIDELLVEKSKELLNKRNYSTFNFHKANELINEIFNVAPGNK